MLRVLFFVLAGPPVGALAVVFIAMPLLSLLAGESRSPLSLDTLMMFPAVLPPAFALGWIPAAVVGVIDGGMVRAGWRTGRRLALDMVIGGIGGLLPFLPAVLAGMMQPSPILLLATIPGVVAAAVCAGLAGWIWHADRGRLARRPDIMG